MTERERFEAWARKERFATNREADGRYASPLTVCSWRAWQAACPDGWQCVPLYPDDNMQAAGGKAVRIETTAINKLFTDNRVYKDMLTAAPKPEDV